MSSQNRLIFIVSVPLIMIALFAGGTVDLCHAAGPDTKPDKKIDTKPATKPDTKNDTKNDRRLAVVNGEVITLADYRIFLLKIDPSLDTNEVSEKLLNRLIEERLILQEARKRAVKVSAGEVEQFIAKNKLLIKDLEKAAVSRGMSLRDYQKWLKENIIVLSKMFDSEIDRGIAVSEKDIANYYRQNKQLFIREKEMNSVGCIVLLTGNNPSPEEMTEIKMKSLRILAELRRGTPFGKMALLHSDDPSKTRDGFWGDFKKGELVPALDAALAVLKEGEISNPVWVPEGVYILKLIKRIPATYRSVDEVRDVVRTTLLTAMRANKYNTWIKPLWQRSTVTIQ